CDGVMAEWVDLELVRALADAMPEAHMVLIGRANRSLDAIAGAPNIHYLGRKPYQTLPAYCKGMDAAILPFARGALTAASNPLKLREYLAAGLPVVATDIPEARALAPAIRVAASQAAFIEQVRAALRAPGPDPARSRSVASESWDAKAAQIERLLFPPEKIVMPPIFGGAAQSLA